MAILMIDYENVGIDGMRGVEYLKSTDYVCIFFSQCCNKISAGYVSAIKKSHCDFNTVKLVKARENALDFYIASAVGEMYGKGATDQIAIISKDKGFQSVVDYWKCNDNKRYTVILAPNIESGLAQMSHPKDKQRRALIQENLRPVELDTVLDDDEKRDNTNTESLYESLLLLLKDRKLSKLERKPRTVKKSDCPKISEKGSQRDRRMHWFKNKITRNISIDKSKCCAI